MPSTPSPGSRLDQAKGLAALLTTGMAFGFFGVLVRWLDESVPTWHQIGLRHAVGLAIVLLLLVWRQPALSQLRLAPKLLTAYAFAFPLSVACFTYAVILTKISVAVFALYAGSLLTAQTLGLVFFAEIWSRQRAFVLGLILIGLFAVTGPSGNLDWLNRGLVLGVASGILDGIANGLRKQLGGRVDRQILVTLQMAGGLIMAGVAIVVTQQSFPPSGLSPNTWALIGLFGALVVLIAYLPLVGFRHLELSVGTVVLASELLFAPAFAAWAFSEYPDRYEWFGGALILTAILASQRLPKSRPKD